MQIPGPPSTQTLERVSPSLYELLITCRARATWAAFGRRGALPQHPAAILGICFHGVAEAAQNGDFAGGAEEVRAAARTLFDELARRGRDAAHPLLRLKFRKPEHLPFYNLIRERAAALAAEVSAQPEGRPGETVATRTSPAVEARFRSADGLLVGRPDLLNVRSEEVVDYKTGMKVAEPWRVSGPETRQLRLYAYLASEAGLQVTRGTIVRGDGQRASVAIPHADAQREAELAREEVARYNDVVSGGPTFEALAQPSPETCASCPCIPLCERFWQAANIDWLETSGAHLEGSVRRVEDSVMQDTSLISLEVDVERGSVRAGTAVIEQIPAGWTTADGSPPLVVGDVVRVIDGRVTSDGGPVVVRVDRTMTAIWRIGAPITTGARDQVGDARA